MQLNLKSTPHPGQCAAPMQWPSHWPHGSEASLWHFLQWFTVLQWPRHMPHGSVAFWLQSSLAQEMVFILID